MARIITRQGPDLDFDDVSIEPQYNRVWSRKQINFQTHVTRNYTMKVPFIAANMPDICDSNMAIAIYKEGGLGVLHRFETLEEISKQSKEIRKMKKAGLDLIAAAIGVKDYKERAKSLVRAGANILVIDIAHAHSNYTGKVLDYLKEAYGDDIDVVAGNIASKDAARYLLTKGADAVKVGIGPGRVCTTRLMTGAGIHQITAIMEVFDAIHGEIPIWADGGIRNPGDVVKALGAGANAVMCGYVFAGCDETPSVKNKKYRGNASAGVKREANYVEGIELDIKKKGPVKDVIKKYLEGLASGMTYAGARDMRGLVAKVDFKEVTHIHR